MVRVYGYCCESLFGVILERDMKYFQWKMAIARSLDWTDERDDYEESKFYFLNITLCFQITIRCKMHLKVLAFA